MTAQMTQTALILIKSLNNNKAKTQILEHGVYQTKAFLLAVSARQTAPK